MTLLDFVKKITNKLQGSEVDSIDETDESLLYANEVLDTYLTMHSQSREAWTKNKFQMIDVSKFELKTPDNVQNIDYIKYNGKKLEYVSTSDFEDMIYRNKGKDGHDANGYGTTKDPEYFTSYDQVTIEVNSIDESVDSAIAGSKTLCYGKVRPTVVLVDTYVPSPLPPSLYEALLSDATASCLNRFMEKSAQYDREMAQRTKVRLNRDNKFDYNYLYIDGNENNDGWGFE